MDIMKAYNYMSRVGMHKGHLRGMNGSVCALGACVDVDLTYEVTNVLDAVAEELYPDRYTPDGLRPIAAVNDHPDTTLDDMRVIFEKAQLRLDERV